MQNGPHLIFVEINPRQQRPYLNSQVLFQNQKLVSFCRYQDKDGQSMQSLESLNDDSYLVLTSEDINVIEKFNTEEPEQAKVQHAVFEDHPVAF
jgi:hypothetical protein